jgi:glycosyltransferase involved in cell wall biosynthesis
MRVLYVNPFSQEVSGPDQSLRSLLPGLTALGVEAHVVLPAPGPQVPRYEALGVAVHFAPLAIIRRKLPPWTAGLFPATLAWGTARVAAIARRIRADLVHSNMEVMLEGGLAARALRLPHVMHYRGNTLDQPKWVFDPLVAIWNAQADHIYCISKATAGIFERRGRAAKVEVMYNPVDLSAYAAAPRSHEVRASLGASGRQPLVGTVGRIHPRKDIETFIRAAAVVSARVPEARFVIVGDAKVDVEHEYQRHLERLSTELGLGSRVVFAGARRDIPEVMRALDIFVLASRHEGFGRVIAEAMAAGKPTLVTNEGAPPELVEGDRYGLVARPQDPEDFARQILRLLSSPAEAATLSERAVERARMFDARAIATRVHARYAALIAAR